MSINWNLVGKWLHRFAAFCFYLTCLLIASILVYSALLPTGMTFSALFQVVILVPIAGFLFVGLLIPAIIQNKLYKSLWIPPLILLITAAISLTGIPENLHWTWMKKDLERAVAENYCPDRAGLVKVTRCWTENKRPTFDFGTGFMDAVVLAYYGEDFKPHPQSWMRPYKDGWFVVTLNL